MGSGRASFKTPQRTANRATSSGGTRRRKPHSTLCSAATLPRMPPPPPLGRRRRARAVGRVAVDRFRTSREICRMRKRASTLGRLRVVRLARAAMVAPTCTATRAVAPATTLLVVVVAVLLLPPLRAVVAVVVERMAQFSINSRPFLSSAWHRAAVAPASSQPQPSESPPVHGSESTRSVRSHSQFLASLARSSLSQNSHLLYYGERGHPRLPSWWASLSAAMVQFRGS